MREGGLSSTSGKMIRFVLSFFLLFLRKFFFHFWLSFSAFSRASLFLYFPFISLSFFSSASNFPQSTQKMIYYESNDSAHLRRPLGFINLKNVFDVRRTSRSREFEVSTEKRTYTLLADSEVETLKWIVALSPLCVSGGSVVSSQEQAFEGRVDLCTVFPPFFSEAFVDDNSVSSPSLHFHIPLSLRERTLLADIEGSLEKLPLRLAIESLTLAPESSCSLNLVVEIQKADGSPVKVANASFDRMIGECGMLYFLELEVDPSPATPSSSSNAGASNGPYKTEKEAKLFAEILAMTKTGGTASPSTSPPVTSPLSPATARLRQKVWLLLRCLRHSQATNTFVSPVQGSGRATERVDSFLSVHEGSCENCRAGTGFCDLEKERVGRNWRERERKGGRERLREKERRPSEWQVSNGKRKRRNIHLRGPHYNKSLPIPPKKGKRNKGRSQ